MIALGLSAADQAAFEKGLLYDHKIRVRASLLTMNHDVVASASGRVAGGQVDWDQSQPVERSTQVQLFDPDNALGLDSGDPREAGLYADRMLRVSYGVWSQQLPRWVDVPMFTGPITRVERDEAVVTLQAHGKESLALEPCSYNKTWPKGTPKWQIIDELLALSGERFREIPRWAGKTTAPVVMAPGSIPWTTAQQIARSFGDVRLAYDGRGVVTLRRRALDSQWLFRTGSDGDMVDPPSLTSTPKVTGDLSALRNFVVVWGGTPKGSKWPVWAIAEPNASNALSPAKLGRNGVLRRIREDIVDETITSKAAAQAVANSVLQSRMQAAMSLTANALSAPHLEPGDVVTVASDSWKWSMTLAQATIPLTDKDPMSIGRTYATRSVNRPSNSKKGR